MDDTKTMNFEGMENSYSKDAGLEGEFEAHPATAMSEIKSNLGPIKEILNHPDLGPLVAESRIGQVLEYDLGEGLKPGRLEDDPGGSGRCSPKDRAPAQPGLWRNAPARSADGFPRQQEMAFRREALTIIQTALMHGRSKFIQKTGVALPGW